METKATKKWNLDCCFVALFEQRKREEETLFDQDQEENVIKMLKNKKRILNEWADWEGSRRKVMKIVDKTKQEFRKRFEM